MTMMRKTSRDDDWAETGEQSMREASPESIYLAWLLHLPEGTDTRSAARREIARLDRAVETGLSDRRTERLRALMIETACIA